ncbi:MAG: aldehyde ferredoxin oxidoreductase N-terminal domain-containing protein, partial [Desulfobacterales bacterium]
MIRDDFRVLVVDLTSGRGTVESLEGRSVHVGGSGLAAVLFERHGQMDRPWNDPRQPIIFAIG